MKNDLNRLLKVISNYKKFIILILIIFIAIGSIYSFNYKTPMYKSTANFVLVQNTDITEKITQTDLTVNQNLISTYSNIAKSNKVLKQVKENLNLNMSEKQLMKQISVNAVKGTEVLEISVSNSDKRLATQIANEVFDIFSEEVSKLYNICNVHIMDYAEETDIPYNMTHAKDIAIFMILGLGVSTIMILLIYTLDSTIKSEKDVEMYTDLTVLSTIPLTEVKKENELIAKEEPKSIVSESFKTLRTNIMYSIQNKRLKTILVTSGYMGEGKSFISSNLAITFAQSGKKVIFIDTDMRKGRLQKIFNINSRKGLSNCLSDINESKDRLNINDYINKTEIPNLYVMTAGNVPPNPSELLASENMKKLLYTLNTIYDVVICDSAPCMLVTDSIILSKIADTTVIVTSDRTTKIKNLLETEKSIKLVGGNVSGVIINKTTEVTKGYKYGYYYGHSEQAKEVTNRELKETEDLLKKKLYLQEIPVENEVVEEVVEEKYNKERVIIKNDNQVKENSKAIRELKSLYKVLMKNTLNILLNKEDRTELILDKVDTIKNVYRDDIEQIRKTQTEYERELLELKNKQEQHNKSINKMKKVQEDSETQMNDFKENYVKDISNIKRKQTLANKEISKFKADYENEVAQINTRRAEDMNTYRGEIDRMEAKRAEDVNTYMEEIERINARQNKDTKKYTKEIAQIKARQAEDMNTYMEEIDRIEAKQAEDMNIYMGEIDRIEAKQAEDMNTYRGEIDRIKARQAEDMNIYMGEIDRIQAKQAEDMNTYMEEVDRINVRQNKDTKKYTKEIAQIKAKQAEDMNTYRGEIDRIEAKQEEYMDTNTEKIEKLNLNQENYVDEINKINKKQKDYVNKINKINKEEKASKEELKIQVNNIEKKLTQQTYEEQINSLKEQFLEIQKINQNQIEKLLRKIEKLQRENTIRARENKVINTTIDTQGKLIEMQRYINSVEQEMQNSVVSTENEEVVNTSTNNNSIGNAIIIKELNVEKPERINKYAIDYEKIKNKSKSKNKLFSFFNKKSNSNRYNYEPYYDSYYEEEEGKIISQILSGTN